MTVYLMVHEISHADKCADQGRGNGQPVYRPQHTAVRYLAREDIEGDEYTYSYRRDWPVRLPIF